MTVDVIEYASKFKDMSWFVLATGDSDFSPLFRRIREMGKGVIGVGPRSTLSEIVKTSCSRFIYTESVTKKGNVAVQSAYEDAVDIAVRVVSNFDGTIHLSTLKQKILNIDSAFNEKELGFSSFSAFIESIENFSLSNKSTTCHLQSIEKNIQKKHQIISENKTNLIDIYTKMLRRVNWRILPKEDLINIFKQIKKIPSTTKNNLLDTVLNNIGKDITPTDVRKAFSIFIKIGILKRVDIDSLNNDSLWGIIDKSLPSKEMLKERDIAIVSRIINSCKEENVPFKKDIVQNLLYSLESNNDIDLIVQAAAKKIQEAA